MNCFPASSRRFSMRRRGAMLPMIALVLPVLLILLGFAVDLAYMQTTRMELQAAADAAARAGATKLSQTDSVPEARTAAKTLAQMNTVAGAPLQLRDSEVEIGRSDRNSAGKWVFTNGGVPANAVRINAARTAGSIGGPVPLFFGSFIGTRNFQPVQVATASFLNVDICVVLDRSTSMKLGVNEHNSGLPAGDPRLCSAPNATSRWRALDGAMRVFVSELAATDADEHVALASYAGDGGFPFPCGGSTTPSTLDCTLSANLNAVSSALDRLSSTVWNGFTFIESGMRTGMAALQDARLARTNAVKILIVMTDGNQNIGDARVAARACAAANITVHTITFSSDANQALMQEVASIGGGQHYHANTAQELRDIFRKLAAQSTQLTE